MVKWWHKLSLWLVLPVIGTAFWFSCQGITHKWLMSANKVEKPLNAKELPQIVIRAKVKAIDCIVKPAFGFTKVKVKTTNSALKTLELEFPVTELEVIKQQIAQELNLSYQTIDRLSYYEIDDSTF